MQGLRGKSGGPDNDAELAQITERIRKVTKGRFEEPSLLIKPQSIGEMDTQLTRKTFDRRVGSVLKNVRIALMALALAGSSLFCKGHETDQTSDADIQIKTPDNNDNTQTDDQIGAQVRVNQGKVIEPEKE